ncbi:hypothetical protein [Marinobacter orientalis]|uniref:Uncharacterized protein n=1 Tax=Marinobacter orientalis TaxID=1928859 RepID=A0A7Y0R9X9_9GAMM|nr:hypothetical protein [Marinobacter orientalis]NMT62189.1 hypothetical protein [Marinobacter orientalis]TGX50906.1 hypothetical protein DIT72_02390 [Marinobacter orientalis]
MPEQGKQPYGYARSATSKKNAVRGFCRRLSFVDRYWMFFAFLIASVTLTPSLVESDTNSKSWTQAPEVNEPDTNQFDAVTGRFDSIENRSISSVEHGVNQQNDILISNSSEIINASFWGEYTSWATWKIVIVPRDLSRAEIVSLAKSVYKKYPKTRVRFFDDDQKIEQQIKAEQYAWDTTGTVPQTQFPTEWRKKHQIAIINDRSEQARNRWQLLYVKGGVNEFMIFLK